MKKNIILGIVFLLSLSIASAQEVVRRGDKHYMFRESTTTKRPLWGTYIPLAPTYGQVYQTADSVLVYGIAFTFRSYTSPVDDNSETSANPIFTEDDFSVDPNNGWAIIADVKGFNKNRSDLTTDLPTFSKKDSVNFESHSQMRKVLFQYEYDINTFKNASSDVVNNTTRCYEFYFDKPVWVANDFYVGYSMKEDKETFDSTLFYPFMWLAREELDYILPSHYYFNNYGDYLSGSNSWKYYQYEFFSWGGVFPIIGLVCGEMSRPQITEVGSSYALMTWDQQGEYDPLYEVAIYDAETDTLFYSDTTGNTHYYFDSLYYFHHRGRFLQPTHRGHHRSAAATRRRLLPLAQPHQRHSANSPAPRTNRHHHAAALRHARARTYAHAYQRTPHQPRPLQFASRPLSSQTPYSPRNGHSPRS